MATKTNDGDQRGAAKRRAIWTGSIQLGLVNVPVKLYAAIEDHRVRFHHVHDQDGARIREERVCTADGARVSFEHIARGYELADGRTVVVSPRELESLGVEASKTLSIEEFVDPRDIDPALFEASYWLAPDRGAAKAYALLAAAMERAGSIAVGRIVIRLRQHLAAIRPVNGALALTTLHYADEVVPASAIPGLPSATDRPHARELELAERLVATRAARFRPERWRDESRERVLAYLARRAAGGAPSLEPARERAPEPLPLMDALRASLTTPQRVPAAAPANEPAPAPRARAGRRASKRAA